MANFRCQAPSGYTATPGLNGMPGSLLKNAGLESCVLKNLGIKGRVLLLTLLPVSLMASVLGGYFTWLQQSELQSQLLQRGEMIAARCAAGAPAMGRPLTPHCWPVSPRIPRAAGRSAVAFLNANHEPLAHAGRSCSIRHRWAAAHLQQRTDYDATRYLLPFGRHRNLAAM